MDAALNKSYAYRHADIGGIMNKQFLETVGAFALALIAGVGIFVFGYMVGGGFPCAGVEAKPKYGHYWNGLDSDEYHQLWFYLQSVPESPSISAASGTETISTLSKSSRSSACLKSWPEPDMTTGKPSLVK